MKVYTLPKDLKIEAVSSIQLFNYCIHNNFLRNKINLTSNTISFLVHGTKEVIGGDESITIENNRFLVMKSGNCLMTENISATNNTYKSILLFFSDEAIIDFLERNALSLPARVKTASFYVYNYDSYIKHYVQSLENILELDGTLQKKLLKAKFEEIMLYLVEKEGAAFFWSILQQHDSTRSHLMNVVENNRLKKLSLQELSFLCNMSVSTFKREFSKQYQETPIRWFQDKRLEHAAILLRTQKKRPIDLYEETGYENFSNFVQAFKKKYGSTPKQYQSKNLNF